MPRIPFERDEAAIIGIEEEYQRKLSGLRNLPPHERPHALRAAQAARQQALKALRDRRAYARDARRMLRQLQRPAPR
jgi:hypothetical protein